MGASEGPSHCGRWGSELLRRRDGSSWISPSRSSCGAATWAIDVAEGVRRILTLALLRSAGIGFRNIFRAAWATGLEDAEDEDAAGGGAGGAEDDEASDWPADEEK
jgi:hypothetical protein